MKKISSNAKSVIFAMTVAIIAVGSSAYTIEFRKLAPGDYRFYSIDGTSSSNPSNYRYHHPTGSDCGFSEKVCSEVWNIGDQIPSDGELASDFISPVKVGLPLQGDYLPK
jgi:hypothetical protein